MKDLKKTKSPLQKSRSLSRGSYFILWGVLLVLLSIAGFYQGRSHKKQWIDQEFVIYFYSDNDFINQEVFTEFENKEGVKVILKKFQNFEELNLEILTYHQDAVMLLSDNWLKELSQKNLLSTLSANWSKTLHQIFQIEKNNQFLPYLWTYSLEKNPTEQKNTNISTWGIGTPSNSDSTENTANLISFLLTKKVILQILENNQQLASTAQVIEEDLTLPLSKKPNSLLNYKLINEPHN